VDVWPDVSSYSPSELFPVPELKSKTGEQAFLFSSRHPKTVQRHFHWMAEHGVDGAFLQRFAGQCDVELGNEGTRKIRDEVGARVREAAELEGRVFAVMFVVHSSTIFVPLTQMCCLGMMFPVFQLIEYNASWNSIGRTSFGINAFWIAPVISERKGSLSLASGVSDFTTRDTPLISFVQSFNFSGP
jgi:hypothetical protein